MSSRNDRTHENDSKDIDYRAEGDDPGTEKPDPTNAGYDEAVNRADGAYGLAEGAGGVFGTTGGGTYREGMHVEERETIAEKPAKEH